MPKFSLSRTPSPIVLLTDFGLRDGYVAMMKGVMRGICRHAEFIDLTHEIAPQDVAEAAFVLAAAYRYFPAQTTFVCVVDPGVGTDRAVLWMRANDQSFLAPDNGLLSVVADQCKPHELRRVTAEKLFLPEPSRTFHGRDVFAPVAARLACGLAPEKLGPPVGALRRLHLPKPVRTTRGALKGTVIHCDRFGNLITNIPRTTLRRGFKVPADRLQVRVKRRRINGFVGAYADVKEGELLALVGSSGFLEVAVRGGSAAAVLGVAKGDVVTVAPRPASESAEGDQ